MRRGNSRSRVCYAARSVDHHRDLPEELGLRAAARGHEQETFRACDGDVHEPTFVVVVRVIGQRRRVDDLCELLREKYDTSVVPGRFFEMPEHFRVGLGCAEETFAEGIECLGRALDEL